MSKDSEFNAWIVSSKFFPSFKHEKEDIEINFVDFFDNYKSQEAWENANWLSNEDSDEELERNNIDWYEGQLWNTDKDNYYVAHPNTWIQLYGLYQKIYFDQLTYSGLFDTLLSKNVKDKKIKKKLDRILFSTLPNPECIKKQLKYIYGDPIRFLLLINYGHAQHGMLKQGRRLTSDPKAIMSDEHLLKIFPRFLVEKRIPEEIIEKYLNTPHLQRYRLLNRMIIRAPYCKTPLILFRGEKWDRLTLYRRKIGYRFVTNSILSTSLNVDLGLSFALSECCLFIYHITDQVPRLFTNARELEILLPAGLEMEYMGHETINHYLCFRIKVLRVVKETIEKEKRYEREGEDEEEEYYEFDEEDEEEEKEEEGIGLYEFDLEDDSDDEEPLIKQKYDFDAEDVEDVEDEEE